MIIRRRGHRNKERAALHQEARAALREASISKGRALELADRNKEAARYFAQSRTDNHYAPRLRAAFAAPPRKTRAAT